MLRIKKNSSDKKKITSSVVMFMLVNRFRKVELRKYRVHRANQPVSEKLWHTFASTNMVKNN